MEDQKNPFEDTMTDATSSDTRVPEEVEARAEEVQAEITEAKEEAKRNWSEGYSDASTDADAMADDLQAKTADLEDKSRDAGMDFTGRADEAHTNLGEHGHNAMDSGRGVVDDVPERSKGFFGKIKDALDGDKNS